MTSIVFYFQVHQPYRLKKFSFFDISKTNQPSNQNLESFYFENDAVSNREIFHKVAKKCYYPATKLFLELVRKHPNFKVSFSLSGTFLEQCRDWDPDLLKIFQDLVATGQVELIQETYYHSLSAVYSPEEFALQIIKHRQLIWDLFGVLPTTFRNTELIYNNYIGSMVQELGFDTILIEGVDRILEWRSPNFVYQASFNNAPKINIQKPNSKRRVSRNNLDFDLKNKVFSSKLTDGTFLPKNWSKEISDSSSGDTSTNSEGFNEAILDKVLDFDSNFDSNFDSASDFAVQAGKLSQFNSSRVANREYSAFRTSLSEDPKKALKKLVKKSILGEDGETNWGLLQEIQEKHLLEYSWSQLNMHSNFDNLRILTKNYTLSDDIAFRFGDKRWPEHPLTADKFAKWVSQIRGAGQVVNLFMDYESFGEHQWAETGIFEFLKHLPEAIYKYSDIEFATPHETKKYSPVGSLDIPDFISWADSERDLSAWRSNNMQFDALSKIYKLRDRVVATKNQDLINTWQKLTTSDHYYYMCTKYWQDGNIHKYFSPYQSPYNAFLYFMNGYQNLIIEIDKIELSQTKLLSSKNFGVQDYTQRQTQIRIHDHSQNHNLSENSQSLLSHQIQKQSPEQKLGSNIHQILNSQTPSKKTLVVSDFINPKPDQKIIKLSQTSFQKPESTPLVEDKQIISEASSHIKILDNAQIKDKDYQSEATVLFPKTYYRSWQNTAGKKTAPEFGHSRSYLFRRVSHKAKMLKKKKNQEMENFWDWVDKINQTYQPIEQHLGKAFVTKKVEPRAIKKTKGKIAQKKKSKVQNQTKNSANNLVSTV